MSKRNIADEIREGLEDISSWRKKKLTLKTCKVEPKPALDVAPAVIRETRERLHMSRGVFAQRLRVSARTLERWEQGRGKPNDQAAALIMLVRRYPDTLERLAKV
ncbi:MAG: helix-turn-helix domain-containing protein [Nitrospinae bacterium]|nr:helix-turn-helix domain-containing protein [Nitrospinota bacterium]